MRIDNRTHYRTEDLRLLFMAGLKHLNAQSIGKVVTVIYTRGTSSSRVAARPGAQGYVSACAQLGTWREQTAWVSGVSVRRRVLREGSRITMRLPKDAATLSHAELARVWEHEVLHTIGVRHRDMTTRQMLRDPLPWSVPDWAQTGPIGVQEAAPVIPLEERRASLIEKRERHAREKLAEHEAKLKRQAALVKKWKVKVRGYERRAARPKQIAGAV